MTLHGRLDKLERTLGPDPNARPLAMFIIEDDAGRWWHNDEEVTRADIEVRRPRLLHISRLALTSSAVSDTHDEKEPA